MADCTQFLLENRLNGFQIWTVRFLKTEFELNFGFLHISTLVLVAATDNLCLISFHLWIATCCTSILTYLHLASSDMWCWSGGRGILTELSLCYNIVHHDNGTQWHEQFLQVGWLCSCWFSSLSFECLWFGSSVFSLCIFGLRDAICIYFLLHSGQRPQGMQAGTFLSQSPSPEMGGWRREG